MTLCPKAALSQRSHVARIQWRRVPTVVWYLLAIQVLVDPFLSKASISVRYSSSLLLPTPSAVCARTLYRRLSLQQTGPGPGVAHGPASKCPSYSFLGPAPLWRPADRQRFVPTRFPSLWWISHQTAIKTTSLACILHETAQKFEWFSLQKRDNENVRFRCPFFCRSTPSCLPACCS